MPEEMTQSTSPNLRETVYSRASGGAWYPRSTQACVNSSGPTQWGTRGSRPDLDRQGGDRGFNRPSVGSNFVQYLEF